VRNAVGRTALFLGLLLFWLILSGQYEPLFIGMGIGAAALTTLLTYDFLVAALRGGPPSTPRSLPVQLWRAVVYHAWLMLQVFPAAVQVASIVLRPSMPIEPAILRFRTGMHSPLGRTIFGNSITFIPGTLTVDLDERDGYVVHVFTRDAADDLVSAEMQERIGAIFLEEVQDPVIPTWDPPRRGGR
jgi:multicomponent Na+:H+ antiporter subunit E